MGEVIVLTGGKGGVGKSTLAANLGICLVRRGKHVVLVDMDMGLRSLDVMLGLEDKVVFDLSDVAEGMCRVKQAVVKHGEIEGLSLVNASQMRGHDALTPRQLERVLSQLKQRFDYVLIDCPAGVGRGFRNALTHADGAMIVVTPDVVSMRSAARVIGLLEHAGVKSLGLVINRATHHHMDESLGVSPQAFEDKLRAQVIGLIPEQADMCECLSDGKPAALGQDKAATAFEDIARRLLGEPVPIEMIKRDTLWKRIAQAWRG